MFNLFAFLAFICSILAVFFVMVFGVVTYRHVAGRPVVTMPTVTGSPLPPSPRPEDEPIDAVIARPRPYAPQDAAKWAKAHLVRRKAKTPTAEVYKAFSAWCRAQAIIPPSHQQLSADLGKMGIERGRAYIDGVQQRVIVGRAINKKAKPL
jgi:hypothetical protein